MVSDKWLSRYGLLKNFDTEIHVPHFEHVLDFEYSPTPGHGPWGPMSWKESQHYRVSMV